MKFNEISKELNSSSQDGFSSLVSLPLFIQNVSGNVGNYKNPLESYRGGVWLYAVSFDTWTLKHEQYLYDLARLTMLLCMEQYALVAPEISEDEGEEYRSKLLGHEVKHVASAMSKNWVRPIQDFFDIESYKGKKPPTNKIGRIEIWDKRFFEKPWINNLGITPFRDLISSAGQLINFWCLLDNPADVPFSEESPPEDFETFLNECWSWAIDTVIMHAFSRENPNQVDRIIEIQKIRDAIKVIYDFPNFNLENANFPRLVWDSKPRSSSQTVWLCRLMVALFTNCVKHSDPTKEVKITVTCDPQENNSYQLEINDYKSLEDVNNQFIKAKLIAKDSSYIKIAEEACSYLKKAKDKLEYLDKKLNISTKDIVQTCLDKLNGKITFWDNNEIKAGASFFVSLTFHYSEE